MSVDFTTSARPGDFHCVRDGRSHALCGEQEAIDPVIREGDSDAAPPASMQQPGMS